MKITRPTFCTTVGIDEYDWEKQFDDAIKAANKMYKDGAHLPVDEKISVPYFPLDVGKVYGILSELAALRAERDRLREALRDMMDADGFEASWKARQKAREALKGGE